MNHRETLPSRGISRKDMMKRVARFRKLKGSDGGLPDSRMPGCERILYNVIGFQPPKTERGGKQSPVGTKASRMAAIKISEGFNLGYCRALPGKGPMLHNHDTNETFIAMTGTWRASWLNPEGQAGTRGPEAARPDLVSRRRGASLHERDAGSEEQAVDPHVRDRRQCAFLRVHHRFHAADRGRYERRKAEGERRNVANSKAEGGGRRPPLKCRRRTTR